MTSKRSIESDIEDLEDKQDAADDLAEMDVGEVYMVMLKANAAGNDEREREAGNEYQERLEEQADGEGNP